MSKSVDVVFVNPGNANKIYQDLANDYSAIEPPTWSLLLAESVRSKNFKCAILDINAEKLSHEQALNRIIEINPRIICFVVYGQNVNAGTVSMSGAVEFANYIKNKNPNYKIGFIGSYVQALPVKTLNDEKSIDIVFTNEAVYALHNILKLEEFSYIELSKVKGLCIRNESDQIILTPPEKIVPNELMDYDLPGYAWDLLPYREKPLDMYRSPLWHAGYVQKNRSPYAAIQTSLGCNFGCSFCMINIVNRDNNDEIGVASNYKGMRFWSTGFILNEFDKLNDLGVKTIRIVDEMFLLYKKHYMPLCQELSKKPYASNLLMWSYSRVDTVTDPDFLKVVRNAGIRWLCLGIESGDKKVRLEVSKGKFEDVDIHEVIKQVQESGIDVMANYIVGLPGDTEESMKKTYDLSVQLNTRGWNMYAAMALPGSELYKRAVEEGKKIPTEYTQFSFHSYDTLPLNTDFLSAGQILKFRDDAFVNYHTRLDFLEKIKNKFGDDAVKTILEMTKIKLKRQIYT